jgi:hypothetical protein
MPSKLKVILNLAANKNINKVLQQTCTFSTDLILSKPINKNAILSKYFVGNPSLICNSQPPSHGLEAHVDSSPQEEMHMNSDKAPNPLFPPRILPLACQMNPSIPWPF